MSTIAARKPELMRTLPGDDVRQILWRFSDRYDLQMLVQSARAVARGPVARLVAEGERNTHEWTAGEERAAGGLRPSRHHRRLHGARRGRLHRRPEEPGAGADGVRTGLGGCRSGHRQPGRLPGAVAHSRARHSGAEAALHGSARAAAAGRRPQALARRILPHRAHSLRRRGHRHAERQGCASRSGRRARSRCCRWRSAGASSPTWASPTSSPPPWIPATSASRAAAWSSSKKAIPASSTAARRRASWCISFPPPAIPIFSLSVPASRIVGGYTVKDGIIVPNLRPQRGDRGGLQAHPGDGGAHDCGQAAFGGRAGHPLSARALPRSRAGASPGSAALRTGHAAAPGRAAPAGRCVGDGRGRRVAGLCRRAAASTSWTRWRSRRMRSSKRRASAAASAELKALRESQAGGARVAAAEAPARTRARARA